MANELARSVMGNIASKQGYERKGGAAQGRGRLSEGEESLLREAIHRGKRPQSATKGPFAPRRMSLEELGGVPAGKKAGGGPRGGAMMSLEELAGRGKRQEGGKE